MNSNKRVWLFFGLVFIISIGAIIYMIFFGPGRLPVAGKNLPELLNNGTLLGYAVIGISVVIVIVVLLNLYRALNPAEIKNGILANAEIVEVSDTGATLNNNPQLRLLLKIKKIDGGTYEAEIKTIVSRLNAALIRPGCSVEVKYDPNKPGQVQLMKIDLATTDQTTEDITPRLEKLAELHIKGLITDEEFSQRKAEILKEV